MTQHKDQMQAEFEQWWQENENRLLVAERDPHKAIARHAWQAARASAPSGVMDDGQWNIEGANTGEIEAYEHGVRSTMSIVQRILDGDTDIGPLSRPMRDYRVLMDEVRALKASAPQGVPEGWQLVPKRPTQSMCEAAKFYVDGRLSVFKWADGYYAMLAEAPQPGAQEGQHG